MDNLSNASRKSLDRVEKLTGKKVPFYEADMENGTVSKEFEQELLECAFIKCGNPSKLRFTALAAYARSRGYEAEAYDFRRDAAVREKIDEITARQETQSRETMTAAYRNIDLDALFRHCPDLETLKRNIHGLDDYWRRVYEEK